ncbi:heavy-metal-associated domain-containing protein [Phaeovulum sp.]|uniref:heavy-metal-associated domain-containing protein n=1 Tax=Phaeovulum sp. TaxID=2934796 RepID=UPI0027318CB8|nr:heavy-metal-associated domain-containing protein [Phaeovulum sp.]MDP1668103.1 heavy-metal-associated domain-containing protein [Phaeovulum sp.]MDP3861377.1 heavy-metal-associated domain-containing protein [Phaeovulum sp.]MDZ4119014.1 heavy-metal-associated domain-containing protein [Phaeovulum sp.]
MTKFNVPEMSCGHCTATITRAIGTVDASAKVECDLASHTVTVAGSSAREPALIAAMKAAGYAATPTL